MQKNKLFRNLIIMAFFVVLIGQSNGQGYSLIYDANLNLIKISHDNLNRTLQINTSSEITNYSYDAQYQGTLTNISFGNSSYKYIYDDKLRVIEEKRIIDGIEFNKKYYYSSNDRSYSMSYDRLDRLTNVSINSYSWIYSFDAIGNILKIIRNNSETTSFKYDAQLAHAPNKVISSPTGIDIYREEN